MDNFESKKKAVANLLLEVEREFGTDVTISMVDILFLIPFKGSIPVSKIRALSRLTEGGVSRVLSTLNAHNLENRRKLEKLIEIFIDDKDRRYRHVKLTQKGKQVVSRFMTHVYEDENDNEGNQTQVVGVGNIEHNFDRFAFNRR